MNVINIIIVQILVLIDHMFKMQNCVLDMELMDPIFILIL